MRAPRLLAVAAVDHPGGAEIGLLRLLAGLGSRGWQTTITTPGPGPLADAARAAGHGWAPLTVGGLARGSGRAAILAWPRAASLAARHDIAYCNGTVPARLLPALRSRRTVLHVHDIVEHAIPRHWRRADVVLADSAAAAAPLAAAGLKPHVVYCPIDPAPVPVAPPWPGGDAPLVGFVGRLEPRKGPLDLIRAVPALRAARPDVRVVIVGDDPYASDPGYEAAVRDARDVEHVGWVEGAAGLLAHLDVLVAPSHREPFGTVAAEALAAGTPVVAGDVDGLREVVDDGVTGRLVAPGDPSALATAILEVLDARQRMGAAGREAVRPFLTPAYVERVAGLIAPGGRFTGALDSPAMASSSADATMTG